MNWKLKKGEKSTTIVFNTTKCDELISRCWLRNFSTRFGVRFHEQRKLSRWQTQPWKSIYCPSRFKVCVIQIQIMFPWKFQMGTSLPFSITLSNTPSNYHLHSVCFRDVPDCFHHHCHLFKWYQFKNSRYLNSFRLRVSWWRIGVSSSLKHLLSSHGNCFPTILFIFWRPHATLLIPTHSNFFISILFLHFTW
jgi:hypothetical protein